MILVWSQEGGLCGLSPRVGGSFWRCQFPIPLVALNLATPIPVPSSRRILTYEPRMTGTGNPLEIPPW
jgi:hypothetical protein